MNSIYHSAKGTLWSKKDHKYVKKENGRYYYKNDMKQIDEKSDTTKKEKQKAVDNAIEKSKDALNSNKTIKAAKSVIKAYAEVKSKKISEQKQKEVQYKALENAIKKAGETKIMGSIRQHATLELTRKANASAQKARLNRKSDKNYGDKGYRNPSDKRYFE